MIKKFIEEFKAFAFKGNVIDMAVGVMIGSAFGKITTSLVNDMFMPLLSLFDVSDAVRMTATQILIAYMFLGPVRHTNYLQVNLFRSGGETRMGMFMEVGGIWLITVPMVLLTGMAIHAPFIIVFISSMVEELVKFPIELKYMLSLKWIKPVTEQGMAAKAAMLEAMEEIKG